MPLHDIWLGIWRLGGGREGERGENTEGVTERDPHWGEMSASLLPACPLPLYLSRITEHQRYTLGHDADEGTNTGLNTSHSQDGLYGYLALSPPNQICNPFCDIYSTQYTGLTDCLAPSTPGERRIVLIQRILSRCHGPWANWSAIWHSWEVWISFAISRFQHVSTVTKLLVEAWWYPSYGMMMALKSTSSYKDGTGKLSSALSRSKPFGDDILYSICPKRLQFQRVQRLALACDPCEIYALLSCESDRFIFISIYWKWEEAYRGETFPSHELYTQCKLVIKTPAGMGCKRSIQSRRIWYTPLELSPRPL